MTAEQLEFNKEERERHLDYICATHEVDFVNHEMFIIYTDKGAHLLQSDEELSRVLDRVKFRIARRDNPISRFEHWEIPDGNPTRLRRILMSRARNKDEKDLVNRYMSNYH